MLFILISISIINLFLIKYQLHNIINNYNSISNSNIHPYIKHNIISNSNTNYMLQQLKLAYTLWIYLWLPISISNIILIITTSTLYLHNYYNINLLYSISILTASSITPILTNQQFPWFNYYNEILKYHTLKFNLILINNILINNKNTLTNNKLNKHELLFIQQYSNKLINISNNLQSEINKSFNIIQ